MGAAALAPAPLQGGEEFSFAQQCRVYVEFARMGFIDTLAYRLRYYTGIVTYFIYVSLY